MTAPWHGVTLASTILVSMGVAANACAQSPRRSQHGSVSQMVANTKISIEYNRPVARGRTVFGGVVRYDRTWHPGADSATTIEVSDTILIGDHELPAGTYSLWSIPRETEPWTFIFSTRANVWHTSYPEGHDALRVDLRPVTGSHMETMAFYFPVVGPDSATLVLHWGETVVEFPIRLKP